MIDRNDVTNAVLATLRAGLGDDIPVGDGKAPTGRPTPDERYVIVYPVDGGGRSGPLIDPEQDIELVYQVTSVSAERSGQPGRRDQAQAVADLVRRVMVGKINRVFTVPMAVTEAVVLDRYSDTAPAGVEREGLTFSVADRYRIALTPA